MKKVALLVFVIMMVMTVTACGRKEDETTTDSNEVTTTAEITPTADSKEVSPTAVTTPTEVIVNEPGNNVDDSEQKLEERYLQAFNMLAAGNEDNCMPPDETLAELENAITQFEQLAELDYKDSAEQVKEAKYLYAKAFPNTDEDDLEKNIELFSELKGYKDSDVICDNLKFEKAILQDKVNEYINDLNSRPEEERYQIAINMITLAHNYCDPRVKAFEEVFVGLGDYKEAPTYAKYTEALYLYESTLSEQINIPIVSVEIQDVEDGLKIFESLGSFLDSANKAYELSYIRAEYYRFYGSELNSYDKAISLYTDLLKDATKEELEVDLYKPYSFIEEKINETKYEKAMYFVDKGLYDDALVILNEIKDYSNMEEHIAQIQFIKAQTFAAEGQYAEAVKCLETIGQISDMRDVSELIAFYSKLRDGISVKDEENPYKKAYQDEIAAIATAKPGDFVSYGNYFGETEWVLLEKQNGKALLIMKFCLYDRTANDLWYSYVWNNSLAREYLNRTFLYAAFTNEERKGVLTTKLKNSDKYVETMLEDTTDRVFILTSEDVNKYQEEGVRFGYDEEENYYVGYWMLRDGEIALFDFVADTLNGDGAWIRPAIWVTISE